MNEDATLKLEMDGPVARLTLNRPRIRNAFDDALLAAITAAAGELAADDSVRAVVLGGAGETFCAGADLHWMRRMVDYSEEENRRDSLALAKMVEALDALPQPVVGRIQGAAIGGGAGLAAVCDIVVAAEDAVFAFSEVRLGLLPAVISPFVVAKIGMAAARDLFLTGERFSAARAEAIGLVQRVVPAADLDGAVEAVLAALLAGGPGAQTAVKVLLREIRGREPAACRDTTAGFIARARAGAEGQEGMRAFLERRRAAWRDRS